MAEIRTIISEIDAQSVPAEWSRSIKLFKTALEFYIVVIERSRDFVSGNLRSVDPAIEAYQSFSRYLEESKRAMPN